MSDEDSVCKQLFSEMKGELYKRQLSNSDNLDKAVLAYSSAGLALSLSFLKDFVKAPLVSHVYLLYMSWGFFVMAVIVTIMSFLSSQRGISKQLKLAERYYLLREDSALTEKNVFACATEVMAYVSGLSFVVALACTTLFVYFNLQR